MSRIVIALGGNALGDTPYEQKQRIKAASPALVGLIEDGHELLFSHGNGPQVGMIQRAFELAAEQDGKIPRLELPECTAMSQGYIGYHLQNGLKGQLLRRGMPRNTATVVTQVQVDRSDPAFQNPTKPIGRFYSAAEAQKLQQEHPDWVIREDSGRGWRRMVPSPKPVALVERDSIVNLLNDGFVVIASGGGGIPVVAGPDGGYEDVAAVIDKDFASAALAEAVNADLLIILTAVDRVSIHFGQPQERQLTELTVAQAQTYCEQGHFGAGSMLPKVRAAMEFAGSAPGRRAIIASLEKAPEAVRGESGTLIRQ